MCECTSSPVRAAGASGGALEWLGPAGLLAARAKVSVSVLRVDVHSKL